MTRLNAEQTRFRICVEYRSPRGVGWVQIPVLALDAAAARVDAEKQVTDWGYTPTEAVCW